MHEEPTAFPHDARAHERLDKLEARMDKVDGCMVGIKVDLSAIKTDVKWIRESLNPRVEKAQGTSDTARALGVVALLAAILAGVLGMGI